MHPRHRLTRSAAIFASILTFDMISGLTPQTTATAPASIQLVTEPQAGITPWIDAIDVNWYLLTDHTLITALRQASQTMPVYILVDGLPYDDTRAGDQAIAAFQGSRVVIHWTPPRFTGSYSYDHAKYLVINPQTSHALAIFGSPNGTASAFDGTNAEVAIETTQPAITQALTTVFLADWTRHRAGAIPRRTFVLSPGSEPALLALLHPSGPIAITTEELGDVPAIYAALAQHVGSVRILVPSTLSASDRTEANALARAGIHLRTLTTPYVHAKLIVTATQIFVGSQNLSESAMNNNREVGLITANPTLHRQALAWFNALWARATPWSTASSRPKTRSYPYLPDTDTPTQVRQAWGAPQRITHTTYQGTPQTVWIYPVGRVYVAHGHVVDVVRIS